MLTILLFTLVGVILGSFSNSVVHRLPRRLNEEFDAAAREQLGLPATPGNPLLQSSRSHCPQCGTQLAWYDNIPLISWLALKAKCRHCKAPISARYFLLELAGGVIGYLCGTYFGLGGQGGALFVAAFLLLWLVVIDFEHMLLPESLNYALLGVGMAAGTQHWFVGPEKALWGVLVGYLTLCVPAMAYRKLRGVHGMGEGDWMLLAALGSFLGPMATVPVLLGASVTSIVGHVAVGARRDTPLPFGPSLVLGGVVVFVLQRVPALQPALLQPFFQ